MKIRPETTKDYSEITALHYEAFIAWQEKHYKAEAMMPAILRQNPLYDSMLAPVAEEDGKIVGHAFYSPFQASLMGDAAKCAFLAPIGVDIHAQKSGVGKALLLHAHEILKEKEFDFGILCGHPSYYPKFGYETGMFAQGGTMVSPTVKNEISPLEEAPIRAADLQEVKALWKKAHEKDILQVYPGDTLSCWISYYPTVYSSMLKENGVNVAYVRYKDAGDKIIINELLLTEAAEKEAVLAHFAAKGKEIVLPMWAIKAKRWLPASWQVKEESVDAAEAFMIMPLSDMAREYVFQIKSGARRAPIVAFPSFMEIDA
ncbi:MAG: GNAT family N-acetyltransferase [Christensenellaceae bacterium]